MGTMRGCLGSPRPRPGPPLTCLITCLTLFSLSSTTRFTPKAPGLIRPKIYQQEEEKHSGNAHGFSLVGVGSALTPFLPRLLLQAGGAGVSTTLRREGNVQEPEKPGPISLGPMLELFPPPATASPTCSRDQWAPRSLHQPTCGIALVSSHLLPRLPAPLQTQHPNQKPNWPLIGA